MISEKFKEIGEYAAAGAFEEPERSLFYRKALGLRRYFESCELYEYKNKPLYPSGVKENKLMIYPYYFNGLEVNAALINDGNRELAEKYRNTFCRYASTVPWEHSVAGNMYCHSMPNYGRIIREGLSSYADRIKNISDNDLREGLLHLCEGIKCYLTRCVEYLEAVGAEKRLVAALKRVPLLPAENIYEAVVSWNFIMYLDNCDNLGCPAKELYDFWHGEDIIPLLENLYDNLDSNNGYSTALNTDYNELTIQCLKAAKGKRRPMIELFVDEATPDEVWNTALEVMSTQGGQPAFYNSEMLLGGLQKRFNIPDGDIKGFCGGGCTESQIAGMSCVGSIDAGINLLLIFEEVLYSWLPKVKSFEELYELYISRVSEVIADVTDRISLAQRERAELNPVPMRTLLVDDCIDSQTEFYGGGARYKWSIVSFAGMINVIDSLLTVRAFIFEDKIMSADEFLRLLKENDSEFLKKCRKNKIAFGVDNPVANELAYKLSNAVYSRLESEKPYIGEGFVAASIQFNSQVYAGKKIGATPDGRLSGAPLCDSLAAIFGKDVNGPTALLKSVTSLNLEKALGTPIFSFNIDKDWDNGIIKALIFSYMQMGGIQMQITCISEEELRDAYEHPDLHGNLVVRVGGYSEYFVNLSDELKRMIMDRTIQKSGK